MLVIISKNKVISSNFCQFDGTRIINDSNSNRRFNGCVFQHVLCQLIKVEMTERWEGERKRRRRRRNNNNKFEVNFSRDIDRYTRHKALFLYIIYCIDVRVMCKCVVVLLCTRINNSTEHALFLAFLLNLYIYKMYTSHTHNKTHFLPVYTNTN